MRAKRDNFLMVLKEIDKKWLDGAFKLIFRFYDFERFLYARVLQDSDFFEETFLKIARFARA